MGGSLRDYTKFTSDAHYIIVVSQLRGVREYYHNVPINNIIKPNDGCMDSWNGKAVRLQTCRISVPRTVVSGIAD